MLSNETGIVYLIREIRYLRLVALELEAIVPPKRLAELRAEAMKVSVDGKSADVINKMQEHQHDSQDLGLDLGLGDDDDMDEGAIQNIH